MIIKRVSRGKVVPYSLKLAAALGGRGLTARAFCHEIDHLDGVLFIDKAIRMLSPEELEQQAKG